MRTNKLCFSLRRCPLLAPMCATFLFGGSHALRVARAPTSGGAGASASPVAEHLDDAAVIDEIRLALRSALSKAPAEKAIPVHELFRALNETLRGHLLRSSFASLLVALKSRPDWFAITVGGITRVSLTDSGRVDSTRPREKSKRAAEKTVLVRGATVASTALDVSRPPLTAEEVEKWRLRRLLAPLTLPFLLDREPVNFFPQHEKPRPLTPELVETDELYSSKGLFPPSEVAAAFIHITPTFFVETRHVLYAMSPEVTQALERVYSKDRVVEGFFKKYPMIFKLKTGKFQKAAIKLNLDFPFIRSYPGCGHADRMLRRHNQEFCPSVGGLVSRPLQTISATAPSSTSDAALASQSSMERRRAEPHIDVKIFQILLRNLPRIASDPSAPEGEIEMKRHQLLPLVEWINGFPKDDIEVLNSVPQQRVLTLLSRYLRIFQLLCHGEDDKLFSPHQDVDAARAARTHSSLKSGCGRRVAEEATQDKKDESVEEGEHPPEAASVDTNFKKREATLREALRDDMIGLDSLLDSCADAPVNSSSEAVTKIDQCDMNDEGSSKQHEVSEENTNIVDTSVATHDTCDDHVESRNCKSDSASPRPTREEAYAEDDVDAPYIPSSYDILYVRRIPKSIAPRSLSDYNFTNTPEPELVECIASLLNPPPSLRDKLCAPRGSQLKKQFGRGSSGPWRWVPVQRIYAFLNATQRRAMRPYKGLVHFLRLHGELFALSGDFMHVIAQDPQGAIPPFVPTQTVFYSEDRVVLPPTFDDDEESKASLIGDADRPTFGGILGTSQIPTDRQQLLLLDPHNPLLDHDTLCEEVSFFLPDHPVTMHQLMGRLPPILRAAISMRRKNTFASSKHISAWTTDGRLMLQKSNLPAPETASSMVEEAMPIEDAIECVRETIPDEGVLISILHRMLPSAVRRTLKERYGSLFNTLLGYPQYFYVEKNATAGDRFGGVVYLVEDLQEKQ